MVAQSQSWTQFDFEVTLNAVGTAQAMGVLECLQPGLTLVSQGLEAHVAFAAQGGLWDHGGRVGLMFPLTFTQPWR